MTFINDIKQEQSYTYTENGALALSTTQDVLADLFATAGALRRREESEIEQKFAKAMIADPLLATKLSFYTRDVRGGLGERRTGRIFWRYLAKAYPEILRKNLALIGEFGRYDDLIALLDIQPAMVTSFIQEQLQKDLQAMKEGKPVSLLAKWLPSVNTSSPETVNNARRLAKGLHMSKKEYRKVLSALRKYLKVTEVSLSAKDYDSIVYPEVPSLAMNRYRNAFYAHDEERFKAYLESVQKGEAKINASVLYPYDIVEKYLYQTNDIDPVLEAQWEALPDYTEGDERFLIVADVSGSMWGRPMATSVGLAIYFAERNKGPFANHFMTFSARPELVEVKGETLRDKIIYVQNAEWTMNTDLEAAFTLILETAVKNHTPADELPTSLVIISDMEFDTCTEGKLFYDEMKERYAKAGYKLPNVVFWNVNSRQDTYHASFDTPGVQLASGQSPHVFETLVEGVNLTPYQYMLEVLNDPRYERITV